LQGRGIEVAQGPEPRVLSLGLCLMDDVRNHEVEQIQGIIHGNIFEAMGKGQEGGQPPLWCHLGDRLGTSCRAIPG
jgi:hypothetical protein